MVAAGAELYLAFHRATSASMGTKDCGRWAAAVGTPTSLIASDAAEPKRLATARGSIIFRNGPAARPIMARR
jgi:hypothetical protein